MDIDYEHEKKMNCTATVMIKMHCHDQLLSTPQPDVNIKKKFTTNYKLIN